MSLTETYHHIACGGLESFPLESVLDPFPSLEQVPGAIGQIAITDGGLESSSAGPETSRSNEIFRLRRDDQTFEVFVDSDISLEDYEQLTPAEDWALMLSYAEQQRGKSIVFINPTWEGGGVAMLRPPLVHMLRALGVDAHWYVVDGRKTPEDPDPFVVTKMMHNISQRQTDERLTDQDKGIHWGWNEGNVPVLRAQATIRNADVIFLDDPQPAPLKKLLEKDVNPNAKWIWRNHIDTDNKLMADPTTAQGEVAAYLLDSCGIRDVDAVIAHPVERFVHPGMEEKTYFGPATTDPFDDLNRRLDVDEIRAGIDFINAEIAAKNELLAASGRYEDMQAPLDPKQKRIVLVARFDESKGMDIAMELGIRTRQLMRESGVSEKILPQVVLIGNGSLDDPSGVPMYEEMLRLRREKYPDEAEHITIMRLKHNYAAMNALMYPSGEVNGSDDAQVIGIQTSVAEGCETRISDWIRHGVPVVVFNNGGMPLQVQEGTSGYVMDYAQPDHDIGLGAEIIKNLMMNPVAYAKMRQTTELAGRMFNDREFTTTANVTRILRVMIGVMRGDKADRDWQVSKMAALT